MDSKILMRHKKLRAREEMVRKGVKHALFHHELTKDKKKFNAVVASLDVIGDVNLALLSISPNYETEDGKNYLRIHGIYQSISLLLGSCREIAGEVGCVFPEQLIKCAAELENVRVIISGHPYRSKQDNKVGRASGSHGIGRYSLTDSGFVLHSWYDDGSSKTTTVSNEHYVLVGMAVATRALHHIIQKIDTSISLLCHEWLKKPSKRHFDGVGYAVEKLSEASRREDAVFLTEYAIKRIEECIESVRNDGLLYEIRKSEIDYELEGISWCLRRLSKHYKGYKQIEDEERLVITKYVCEHVSDLLHFCSQLDLSFMQDAGIESEVAFDGTGI